ncbi:MAG: ABC transporter permease, partial [Clostridiales bacterium]|nr:ABC transporter permease [Clostridiales bacterium]
MNVRQIRKRLLQMLIVLFGISFLTFILTYLSPGDPVTAMYSASGSMPSEAVLEATREELGLNKPFLVQYWNWLAGCLQGDFGTSYSMHKPVLQLLSSRLLPTLKLAFVSLLIMLIVSVPLGMLAAVYRGR